LRDGLQPLVVVAGLQEVDALCGHAVDETVFARYSSAPATGIVMLKSLRFADPSKWIGENRLDKFERFECSLPVVLDPPGEVFPELWKEIDTTFGFGAHGYPLLLRTT
jgi:hypothetical protein